MHHVSARRRLSVIARTVLCLALVVMLAACGIARVRNPVPAELANVSHVPGMPHVRTFAGTSDDDFQRSFVESIRQEGDSFIRPDGVREYNILAISGGGAYGAYGAGVLNGWTDAGDRPTFKVVTGVSTGALGATFAFLGSAYDQELKDAYTTVHTKDIFTKKSILTWSDSMSSTAPLAELIAEVCTPEVLEEVAAEHAAGRRLYIGTTDLDENRFVVWDMGAIATYGTPEALELYRSVLLASASIPIMFPPVYLDVEANGEAYDEMHVDGGVKAQVFVGGFLINHDVIATETGVDWEECDVNLYVIRNGLLRAGHTNVEPKLGPIAEKTLSSMIDFNAVGDLYRIYLIGASRGVDFNVAYMPEDYIDEGEEAFDPVEMTRLYEIGFDQAKTGYPWMKTPPALPQDVVETIERGVAR